MLEISGVLEALVERCEQVDSAVTLERNEERVVRVELALAARDDVEHAACKLLGLLCEEAHFAIVKPLAHRCYRGSQCGGAVFRCAARRQSTDNVSNTRKSTNTTAVPLGFQSRGEINRALVQRVIGVEQGNDDVRFASRTTSAIVEFVCVNYRVGWLAVNDSNRIANRSPRSDDVSPALTGGTFRGRDHITAFVLVKVGERTHQLKG